MSKAARKKLNQREQLLLNQLRNALSGAGDTPASVDANDLVGLISKGAVKSNISQGWQMTRITGVKQ